MTVAVAWTRKILSCEELIFTTDSRLSGDGRLFDACPKVVTLPRSDCAIAFAGYSGVAYPMMQQLAYAIDAHAAARRRSLDLTSLRSHVLKIFDSMVEEIRISPGLSGLVDTDTGAGFILGGYDWIKKDFEIWTIVFDPVIRRFTAHPPKTLVYLPDEKRVVLSPSRRPRRGMPMGRIAFAGDQGPVARERLLARFPVGSLPAQLKLDWEPFAAVRDMLRDPNHAETIGGAPQVVKVYQYMDATAQGVYWPSKADGRVHLQGRACLGYERIEQFVLDPDTLRSEALNYGAPITEAEG